MSNGEVTTVGIPSLFGLTGTKTAFQDEGILLGNAQAVNFVGDGVVATLAAGVLTVQIDGGSSSIGLITTLDAVTESDVTNAVTPSVIYDLDVVKADLANPTFTGTPTAPTPQTEPFPDNSTQIATTAFVNTMSALAVTYANAYADGLVVNLWDDRGTFDASATTPINPWPDATNNGSGISGAIQTGDIWTVSAAGTLTGGVAVETGDVIRALVNNAGNTSTDWAVTQNNLGYTAENSTNKVSTLAYHVTNNAIQYPTVEAVRNDVTGLLLTGYATALVNAGLATTDSILTAFGKLQKQISDVASGSVSQASLRYVTVTKAAISPTIDSADVTPTGSKLVVLDYTVATSCALDTPDNLGKSVGDSVNIIQGNVGPITVMASSLIGAKTTSTTAVFSREGETKTFIAASGTSWRVIGA